LRGPAQLRSGRAHAAGRCQGALGLFKQPASRLGESHAARRSVEELDAQFVFQRLDLGAHRRRAGEHPLGSTREAAFLGNGHEGLELIQLHERIVVAPRALSVRKS
jgi:hypothetical protein